jgi:hypothetical protein
VEQLPLDPAEREYRQVDDRDDDLPEQARAEDLHRGIPNNVTPLFSVEISVLRCPRFREPPNRVLHDDYRTVHD